MSEQADAAVRLDSALEREIGVATRALDLNVSRAEDLIRWLPVVIALVVVFAAAAAIAGLQMRLREYQ